MTPGGSDPHGLAQLSRQHGYRAQRWRSPCSVLDLVPQLEFGSSLMKQIVVRSACVAVSCAALWVTAAGQQLPPSDAPAGRAPGISAEAATTAKYVIGVGDVLQLIAVAGGLREYADKKHIVLLRTENGRERRLNFNYDEVLKGKNLKQNILLQPGDTVMVR